MSDDNKGIDPKLLEILVCPLTKGALSYDKDAQELIRQSLYKAGEEAFDTGRWSQAIGYFRQTAESDPNYASAQDRIGISFYEMAREALGKGDATEALRLSNIVQTTCSQFSAARDIARAARGRLPDRQEIASRN